jgi:hypothetical protein
MRCWSLCLTSNTRAAPDRRRTIPSYNRIKISLIGRILNSANNRVQWAWTARCYGRYMLFDLWVLCLIATGLGMFLVSTIGDALSHLRRHRQEPQSDIDPSGAPMGWGH